MPNLSLFESPEESARRPLAERLRQLAADNVYIGTSSWKYPGWLGQIYTPERYMVRGKVSKKRFQETCLAEYAETFPVVCGDFTFYQFPSDSYWRRLFTSAPDTLLYAFKVPEDITVKVFPTHARYGARAGLVNENYLNAALFTDAFLSPLEPYRKQVAACIFEFGAFPPSAYRDGSAFAHDLDRFLGELPAGHRYSVEIRTPEFLTSEYFGVLHRHGVSHVFNAWARMPELSVQMNLPDSRTAGFTVTRALLKRGRDYSRAVGLFEPYDRIQDPNPEGREALRKLIRESRDTERPAFIFVNNRFEGNAPGTIEAITSE